MSDNPWNEPEKQEALEKGAQQKQVEAEGNDEEVSKAESKLDKAVKNAQEGVASKKEWKLIEKLLNGLFVEQRRARRWGIFFKLLTFGYLFLLLGLFFAGKDIATDVAPEAHTAIIEIKGPISADDESNADTVIWALRDAFKEEKAKAVILRINSPGGSPVQAGYIYDEIKRLGYTANLVVITGGEPCMYDLRELTHLLHEFGFHTQIETSGTYPVLVDGFSWVTVSPKINMRAKKEVLTSALERANEIKHPVGTEKDIEQLDTLLHGLKSFKNKTICLQPISQKPKATALCMQTCIERNWRLSVQVHKYLDID